MAYLQKRKFKFPLVLLVLASTILGSLYFVFLSGGEVPAAEAVWMDESWAYRRPLTIGNSSEVTNRRVLFDIDTATLEPDKMQTDCDDARFTDINGDILRYFLDSSAGACNTGSTDFWVLFPTVFSGATSTVVYFYYGNPSAGPATQAAQFSESSLTPDLGSTYGSESTGPGPVGYWKFDEGFGQTVNDASSANNDATNGTTTASEVSDPSWRTEDVCISGKCLEFDGTDDNVQATSPFGDVNFSTQAFSVSMWVKFNTIVSAYDSLIYLGVTTGSNLTFELFSSSTFDLFAVWHRPSTDNTDRDGLTVNAGTIQANRWHHIAVTHNGSSIDAATSNQGLYIDGVLQTDADNTGSFNPYVASNVVRIGGKVAGVDPFDGFIDEVKVYPYARTAAQVREEFLARGQSKGASATVGGGTLGSQAVQKSLSDGLVGYWPMDESAANTCSGGTNDSCDKSGNANDGAWTGNATASSTAQFGRSVNFDGTGDYTSIADAASLDFAGGEDFTLVGWFLREDFTSEDVLLAKRNSTSTASDAGYIAFLEDTDTVVFEVSDGTDTYRLSSASTFTSRGWNHFAVVWDDDSAVGTEIYINGSSDGATDSGTIADIGDLVNSVALVLGTESDGATGLDGAMDEARVYNRALSAKEIRDLYYWAPGPVGYWNFDEGSGTSANDRSTNSNTGTLNNMSTSTNGGWTQGRFGKGLDFDGTDDEARVPDSTVFDVGTVTLAAWFFPHNATGGYQVLFIRDDDDVAGGCANYGMRLVGTTGQISYIDCNDRAQSTTPLPNNRWSHVAVTFDGTNSQVYINGVLESTTAASAIPNVTSRISIGGWLGIQSFDGLIDDVRIYNYARTAKQIVEDMNAGHPAVGSPVGSPVLHLGFDEVQGQTLNNKGNQGSTLNGTRATSTDASASDATWKTASECRVGGCLDYDASNDFSEVDDNAALDFGDTADFTLAGWFWLATSTADGVILAKRNSLTTPTDAGYVLYINTSNDTLVLEVSDGTDEYSATSTATFNSPGWNHFAVVWDQDSAANTEIYINGQDDNATDSGTIANVGDLSNAVVLRVGSESDGASYFRGKIDEVKIYNFALTPDEIKLEYNMASAVNWGTGRLENTNDDARFYWKLDEGAGSTAVNSGNATNTSNGTVTGATWREGNYCKINVCLEFDGTDDYVEVSDNDSLDFFTSTDDFTIEGWFWRDSATTDDVILAKRNSLTTNTDAGYILYIDATGDQLVLEVSDGTDEYSATSTTAFTSTGWYHFTAVWDDGSAANTEIYINGVDDNATDSGTIGNVDALSNAVVLRLGSESDGASFFDGFLDEVKIYAYARSPAQIAADAATGPENPARPGAPVAEWKFDEHTGSTFNDTSGNGNTATSTNKEEEDWRSAGDCMFGSCLDFDGTNEYLTANDSSNFNFGSNGFSISFWVNFDAASGERSFISQRDSAATAVWRLNWNFCAASCTNQLVLEILSGGTWTQIINPSWTPSTNRWYNIVLTRRGNEWKFFADAVQQGSTVTNSSSVPDVAAELRIGSERDQAFIDGKMDQIRIYDYGLTPAQIAHEYNRGRPVAHWKFDECQGATAYDSSGEYTRQAGTRNNGTITIGVTGSQDTLGTCWNASTTAAWANASSTKMNSGLSFDGTDDYVNIADEATLDFIDGSDFTIAGWFYRDTATTDDVIAAKRNSLTTASDTGYIIYIDAAGDNLILEVSDGTDEYSATSIFAFTSTGWYHFAAVFDDDSSTNVEIYVNGIDDNAADTGTLSAIGSLANAVALRVASESDGASYFDGRIDDVRLYNYALDAEQIRKVMNDGAAVRFGPDTGQP